MNSPGPPQSRFDILSWLRTTWTLRTPRVTEGHFVFFVPNLYNMGVYGLPWTPTSKIWDFELTQDHLDPEDTEGNRRSLRPFCSQPLQYGCLWTPLDPSNQDLTFWANSRPPGHRGYVEVILPFLFQTPTIWATDSPKTYQLGYDIYLHKFFGTYISYNPLGSRSEQGRPEGPILRVIIIYFNIIIYVFLRRFSNCCLKSGLRYQQNLVFLASSGFGFISMSQFVFKWMAVKSVLTCPYDVLSCI